MAAEGPLSSGPDRAQPTVATGGACLKFTVEVPCLQLQERLAHTRTGQARGQGLPPVWPCQGCPGTREAEVPGQLPVPGGAKPRAPSS